MPVSTYLANKLLDHVLRNVSYTPPATVYLALYTSNPTADDTGTEVSGGNYARVAVTFAAAAARATSNSAIIDTVRSTASWGTPSYFGLRDASTAGNLLFYGTITAPVAVAAGKVLETAVGDLDVSMT